MSKKEQRQQAAKRIQKTHDEIETSCTFNRNLSYCESHIHRAELLTLLADAERENEELVVMMDKANDLIEKLYASGCLRDEYVTVVQNYLLNKESDDEA